MNWKAIGASVFSALSLAHEAHGASEPPLIPEVKADRRICFTMYTVSRGVLKLTAQLYPIPSGIGRDVFLDVRRKDGWKTIGREQADGRGWVATFRVGDWDASSDVSYRVRHGNVAEHAGVVRKDPAGKGTIVVAAFCGNFMAPGAEVALPKTDLVANIKKLKPDLLFFAGRQVIEHDNHLAHWLKFGREFGEVLCDYPSVCLPDADDVGQDHLWSAGGKKAEKESGEDGGYYRPAEYVAEVERAQMAHLPDPHDGSPLAGGIGVHHTSLTVGRVSFAIIDGRKFKAAPTNRFSDNAAPWLVTTNAYDPSALDTEGADLLGERQLKFLRAWAADWGDCDMKAVLSQSVFCGGPHLYGSRERRVRADLDSNGWPKSGRERAVDTIRRASAVEIAAGDHLAYVVQHGIEDWGDACYSFAIPPMANRELRWWAPESPGKNRPQGAPEHMGDFLDGFGNRVTMVAVANPSAESHDPGILTARAAGFGVIRFNRQEGEITFECWPRNADVGSRGAKQYPGWPITIQQGDNNKRKPTAHLAELTIKGAKGPVIVEVIDDASGETLYARRVKSETFKPGIFRDGPHTINVTAGSQHKNFPGVLPAESGGPMRLEVDFSPPPPPVPEKEKTSAKKRRSRR